MKPGVSRILLLIDDVRAVIAGAEALLRTSAGDVAPRAVGIAAAIGLITGSARRLIAGLLDGGHTRLELFGTEVREELERLAATLLGGLALLILAALALAFGGAALVLSVQEGHRLAAASGVALIFAGAAGLLGLHLRRLAARKRRAFDATLSELQRDLDAIRR